MRDMERKREYDRQRMARLHAAGETWWQRNADLRREYDRDPVHRFRHNLLRDLRNAERVLAELESEAA